ncbi:hypothetical protein ASZ90_009518 [hydrocarbon metagenome]|uniref:Uncharacterized protein n=1 Tax=hydrocarbon metagenome TaxID=938273 RepID=A0A0W8FIL9_9ZZZZ
MAKGILARDADICILVCFTGIVAGKDAKNISVPVLRRSPGSRDTASITPPRPCRYDPEDDIGLDQSPRDLLFSCAPAPSTVFPSI